MRILMDKIEKIDKIEKKQFYGNKELVSYVVPETVTEIGDWAFARCRRLKWIAVPKGLERIEREAFAGCESLVVAHFYEGNWEETWEGSGKESEQEAGLKVRTLSKKQQLEGELMALALRYFPEAQSIVNAMRDKTLAAGAAGWLRGWDEACGRFLQRLDEEGFVPFLAGGEEDYADDGESLAAYCREARLTKAKVVYRRLLADLVGAEWGFGLTEEVWVFYQAALRDNDGNFAVLMGLDGYFREAVELYEAAGLLTQEKIRGLLQQLPEDMVELRALYDVFHKPVTSEEADDGISQAVAQRLGEEDVLSVRAFVGFMRRRRPMAVCWEWWIWRSVRSLIWWQRTVAWIGMPVIPSWSILR